MIHYIITECRGRTTVAIVGRELPVRPSGGNEGMRNTAEKQMAAILIAGLFCLV